MPAGGQVAEKAVHGIAAATGAFAAEQWSHAAWGVLSCNGCSLAADDAQWLVWCCIGSQLIALESREQLIGSLPVQRGHFQEYNSPQ